MESLLVGFCEAAWEGRSFCSLLQQLLDGNLEAFGEFLCHLLLLETGFHVEGGWGHCVHAHIFHQCETCAARKGGGENTDTNPKSLLQKPVNLMKK